MDIRKGTEADGMNATVGPANGNGHSGDVGDPVSPGLTVEIWSDVVCPWCYIGKRRFESALASFEHADQVEVRWRSFELDPNAPMHNPGTMAKHQAARSGSTLAQAAAELAGIDQLAA